jgi:hypothetical protein
MESRRRGDVVILYENGDHWVKKTPQATFEVYKNGVTCAERVASIGYKGPEGFKRAKDEADRREAKR